MNNKRSLKSEIKCCWSCQGNSNRHIDSESDYSWQHHISRPNIVIYFCSGAYWVTSQTIMDTCVPTGFFYQALELCPIVNFLCQQSDAHFRIVIVSPDCSISFVPRSCISILESAVSSSELLSFNDSLKAAPEFTSSHHRVP